MRDIDALKYNPAAFYTTPAEVVYDKELSTEDKIAVLNQWAYDEREKEVAEEENMPSTQVEQKSRLSEILKALQNVQSEKK